MRRLEFRNLLFFALNPSKYGKAMTFAAVVPSSIGAPPDGETVSFLKSKAVKHVVSKATTTLTSSLNPSNFRQSVTSAASESPQFSGTPTGKVAFYDGQPLLRETRTTCGP
jgi:hypothetical protein